MTPRAFTTGIRAATMIFVGAALIVLPLALALSAPAILLGVAAGVLAVALGFAGTAHEGRGTVPVTVHALYDRVLALTVLVAALGFGAFGQDLALLVFGLVGVITLAVATTTRYVAAPAT